MKILRKILTILGWGFAAMMGLMLLTVTVAALVVFAIKESPDTDLTGAKIKTDHAVGVIDLMGEIMSSEKFERSLKQQLENKKIKAIVIRIDSPGGAVGASEEIYRLIRSANDKKPTVCVMGSVAASGGLYSAVGCKKIVANAGTLTGSIGVVMMTPNVTTLLDKVGVKMNVVKSGKYKDTGSPFREFGPEDREFLQGIITRSYEQFLRIVSESRGLPVEAVRKFADGRIILGEEAKELGLIDEIGGLDRAAKLALELAGDNETPEIVMPAKGGGFMSFLREMPDSGISRWWSTLGRTQIRYDSFL